jgi:hypothetical protein
MKPLSLVTGFIPLAVFAVLVNWLSLGWAAAIGLALAAGLVAFTATRGGVKVLPIVQSVVLAVFTIVGFTIGSHDATAFEPYARGVASLALGGFILATSFSFPFTVQFARQGVPQQYWKSPQFLALNRRISLAWGLAVLAVGAGHLGAAYVGGSAHVLRLLLDWGIPALATYRAYSVTKRAIAQNASAPQPDGTDRPAAASAH